MKAYCKSCDLKMELKRCELKILSMLYRAEEDRIVCYYRVLCPYCTDQCGLSYSSFDCDLLLEDLE